MSAPRIVPALSVRQPWAWAIVAGHKTVENRVWSTVYRGPLLIHASTRFVRADVEALRRGHGLAPQDGELIFGAVIGRVQLVDVVTDSGDAFALPGHYHFVLAAAEALRRPVPCKGRLGLFQPGTGRAASRLWKPARERTTERKGS